MSALGSWFLVLGPSCSPVMLGAATYRHEPASRNRTKDHGPRTDRVPSTTDQVPSATLSANPNAAVHQTRRANRRRLQLHVVLLVEEILDAKEHLKVATEVT